MELSSCPHGRLAPPQLQGRHLQGGPPALHLPLPRHPKDAPSKHPRPCEGQPGRPRGSTAFYKPPRSLLLQWEGRKGQKMPLDFSAAPAGVQFP